MCSPFTPTQNSLSPPSPPSSMQLPNVPVDPRNGLDMRTLCAAQNPSYLSVKQGRTYETTPMARRPYYEVASNTLLRLFLHLTQQMKIQMSPLAASPCRLMRPTQSVPLPGRDIGPAKGGDGQVRLWKHILQLRGAVVQGEDARSRQVHDAGRGFLRGGLCQGGDHGEN
jgi:hypothetical protein